MMTFGTCCLTQPEPSEEEGVRDIGMNPWIDSSVCLAFLVVANCVT